MVPMPCKRTSGNAPELETLPYNTPDTNINLI